MPVVVASSTSGTVSGYATEGEVRGRYATAQSSTAVARAIEYASALIDARTGRHWGPFADGSVWVDDVRGDNVVITEAFKDVTSVVVDGSTLDTAAYRVMPWGIRLLSPPHYGGGGRGALVTVAATFGGTVPALVTEATILLAIDYLTALAGTTTTATTDFSNLPSNLSSLSVEGLSMSFSSAVSTVATTGNTEADRLLDLLTDHKAGVA